MKGLPLIALMAIALAACDDQKREITINLDSAGSKIGAAGEKIGQKLDTAFSNIKSEVNEAQIEAGFHKMQGMENVEVELIDSTVRLYGTVSSEEDRAMAERIVGRLKGVAGVRNELTIGRADSARVDTAGHTGDTAVLKK